MTTTACEFTTKSPLEDIQIIKVKETLELSLYNTMHEIYNLPSSQLHCRLVSVSLPIAKIHFRTTSKQNHLERIQKMMLQIIKIIKIWLQPS